jgi:hypothetical protein
MAISRSSIALLMRESKRRAFQGSILQLGRQEVWADKSLIISIAKSENYNLCKVEDYPLKKSKFVNVMCMDDIDFFKALGFTSVHSLDINDFEGADFCCDLNFPIEKDLYGKKYDLIYNGGTLEHIFHLPNAMENIFKLLEVNGRVIHSSPVDMFNHGFYNFSSCIFEDYYAANNFEINKSLLIRKPYDTVGNNFNGIVYCTDVSRDSQFIRSLSVDTFDGAEHGLFFVVTKLSDSTGNKIPLQGYYADIFHHKNTGNSGLVSGNSLFKSIYAKLKLVPLINSFAGKIRNTIARSLVKWKRI